MDLEWTENLMPEISKDPIRDTTSYVDTVDAVLPDCYLILSNESIQEEIGN